MALATPMVLSSIYSLQNNSGFILCTLDTLLPDDLYHTPLLFEVIITVFQSKHDEQALRVNFNKADYYFINNHISSINGDIPFDGLDTLDVDTVVVSLLITCRYHRHFCAQIHVC